MPISQIRELRLSGTVAAQVIRLRSANLEWSPGLAGATALALPLFPGNVPRGASTPPHIYRLGSVSSLLVPLQARPALAFSELSQGLKRVV